MSDDKTNHFQNSNECNKNLFLLSSDLKQHQAHNNNNDNNKNFEYYKISEDSNAIKDSSNYENSKTFSNSSNNLKQQFNSSYTAAYSPYQQYQTWQDEPSYGQATNSYNYGSYTNNASANYSWSLSNQNYNSSSSNNQFRSHYQPANCYGQMNNYNTNFSQNDQQQTYNWGPRPMQGNININI